MSQAYCVKCRKNIEIQNPKTVFLKNKILVLTGTCPTSGTKVYRFIKRNQDPINALKIAIEREKEAQQFYTDTAAHTEDNNGKKMLQWLANEEGWHRAGLEKQLKSMMSNNAWEEWQEINTAISQNELSETAETAPTREATSSAHITESEESALRTAMRTEQKTVKFYHDFGEATTDPEGKKVFQSLVKQEAGHLKVLQSAIAMIEKHKRYPCVPRFF